MKILISVLIGVFAVAAILSGVLLYQNTADKDDEVSMETEAPSKAVDTPSPQTNEPAANDTTEYEIILAREVESGETFPQVGYDDCLVVKLMPEDEPIQADSIETDEVILTLCDKLDAYSMLLDVALQNMGRNLIEDIPGLMGAEEAILTARTKNDIIIAMRNLELKAAKAQFEADIIKYKYGEISKEAIDSSAGKYLAVLEGAIESIEALQGQD